MLTSNKLENKGLVEFEINGNIDTQGVQEFSNTLKTELAQGRKVKLMGTFNKIPGFASLKALKETMKMKVLALRALSKYAILTKLKWVRKVVELGDKLLPSIPLRTFTPNQRKEAEEWLLN